MTDIPRLTVIKPTFIYRAKFIRAIDGDTVVMEIDQGLYQFAIRRVRLMGVNCPEMKGRTKAAGIAAKQATEAWFRMRGNIVIQTEPDPEQQQDDFGRWLANIWGDYLGNHQDSLSDHLLANGHATPYAKRNRAKKTVK